VLEYMMRMLAIILELFILTLIGLSVGLINVLVVLECIPCMCNDLAQLIYEILT
jgi:hypothetical protein